MSLLDELFGQILQSEESIKQRFDQLKEAHSQILDYQSNIKDAEFERQSLLGTISVKNHKLAEKEVELKWLTSKAEILQSTILKHKKVKKEKLKQTQQVEEIIQQGRSEFTNEARDFLCLYEFSIDFESEYDRRMKRKLKEMNCQKKSILQEYEDFETSRAKAKALKDQIDATNKSIMSLIFEKEEKEEAIKVSRQETTIVLTKKDEVEMMPQKCLEFKRLSEDLNRCLMRSEELCKKRDLLSSQLYNSQQENMRRDSYGGVTPRRNKIYNVQMEKNACLNNWSTASKINYQQQGRVSLFKTARSNSHS